MILEKVKSFLLSLPHLRGKRALVVYLILIVSLFLCGGFLALAFKSFFTSVPVLKSPVASSEAKPEERNVAGPINGVLYTPTEAKLWQNRKPLAVVIENHLDSRPQSGLSSADVVYEALAEGGITRHLGIYLTNKDPVYLGPIRSMRTYFLDWLEEYDALAVHVGGNMDALDRINPEHVKDLDQFSVGSPTYFRTSDRFAPHNVYTWTDRLLSAGSSRGYSGSSSFENWTFKDESSSSSRPASQNIHLGYLGDRAYQVDWGYDPKTNVYLKSDGGQPLIDLNTKQQISSKTVVVQIVPFQNGTTRIGEQTLVMQDIGSGKAYVFTDGVVRVGSWQKPSRSDRTIFLDDKGAQIPFNRGAIWIEIVPPNTTFNY